jgi:hypothetical protein
MAPTAAALAVGSLLVARTRARRPDAFRRLAALWLPVGERIGGGLSFAALSLVYWTVLVPLGWLGRGRRTIVSTPAHLASLPSYWRAFEAPRGGPDRMF